MWNFILFGEIFYFSVETNVYILIYLILFFAQFYRFSRWSLRHNFAVDFSWNSQSLAEAQELSYP